MKCWPQLVVSLTSTRKFVVESLISLETIRLAAESAGFLVGVVFYKFWIFIFAEVVIAASKACCLFFSSLTSYSCHGNWGSFVLLVIGSWIGLVSSLYRVVDKSIVRAAKAIDSSSWRASLSFLLWKCRWCWVFLECSWWQASLQRHFPVSRILEN